MSQSLHLWQASSTDARDQVRRLGKRARIFASNNRWTSLVPDEIEALIEISLAAPGLVALWSFAADYALEVVFFKAGAQVGKLIYSWVGADEFDAESVAIPHSLLPLLLSLGVTSPETEAGLVRLGATAALEDVDPKLVRDRAAALLSLPAYEWLAPDTCFDDSLDEVRKEFPDAQDVDDEDDA